MKKVTIQTKEVASTGTNPKTGKAWTKFKYGTSGGEFFLFDDLDLGVEVNLVSKPSADGKYTNWYVARGADLLQEEVTELRSKLNRVLRTLEDNGITIVP